MKKIGFTLLNFMVIFSLALTACTSSTAQQHLLQQQLLQQTLQRLLPQLPLPSGMV